jgi:hypothetical protein
MNYEEKILNLGEAATLLTIGIRMERIEQCNNKSSRSGVPLKIFVFSGDKDEIGGHLERYRHQELQVDALTFFTQITNLKKRIHDMNELAST